ncbi:hypothetical protein AMR41_28985 [Hapalosiphon sp. MRB220]|nr:hypothetical protein AMR41_28985 [Hapalosiphon sp. MRB220]
MKIAIFTVQVPFISGGAEIHAASLKDELCKRGYQADIVTIPFKWYPPEQILDCMFMARLVDLEEVNGEKIDLVITLKFPAYYVKHHNKVGWILHQHRQAYELYGTQYGDLHNSQEGRLITQEIRKWDNKILREYTKLFANSETVARRINDYNGISNVIPLYHPPKNSQRFYCGSFGDYIFYPSRLDQIKRQHLIIEAIAKMPEELKVVLAGSYDSNYGRLLLEKLSQQGLNDRVVILGPISEEEKVDLYAGCLAVYNGVYEEDYGYVTLEAFLSGKPVITHTDSGGPLEFVKHEINGYIIEPQPDAIRECLYFLAANKSLAKEMGVNAQKTIAEKNISWDYVIERLTS